MSPKNNWLVGVAWVIGILLIHGCAGSQVRTDDSGVITGIANPGEKIITVRVAQGILTPAFKLEATLIAWEERKTDLVNRLKRERYTNKEIEAECDKAKADFDRYISFAMRAISSKPLYSTRASQMQTQDIIKKSMELADAYQKAYEAGGTKQPPSIAAAMAPTPSNIPWNGDTYLLIDERGGRHKLYKIDNPTAPKVSIMICTGCDNFFYEYTLYFEKELNIIEPGTQQLKLAVISETSDSNMTNTAYNLDLIWHDVGKTYYGNSK